jgi:hypothetical protein
VPACSKSVKAAYGATDCTTKFFTFFAAISTANENTDYAALYAAFCKAFASTE